MSNKQIKKLLNSGYRKKGEPIDIDKLVKICDRLDKLEKQNNKGYGSFKAGVEAERERIIDLIMKKLYNEETCNDINELFMKIDEKG